MLNLILRRWVIAFAVLVSWFGAAQPLHVAAQWDADSSCPNADGKYYQSQTYPRFQADTGKLVMISRATHDAVEVVDQGLQNVGFLSWSPDCRYLVGTVPDAGGKRWDMDSIVWDMVHLKRVALYPHTSPMNWYFDWDPSSNYVVLGALFDGTSYHSYLWNVQAQSQVKLTDDPCNMVDEYFDLPAGQLLVVRGIDPWGSCTNFGGTAITAHQVTVYSLQTGQVIRQYGDPNAVYDYLEFSVSPDNSKLVLYAESGATRPYGGGYLAVVERSSGAITELNPGTDVPNVPIFSPDNRYIVTAGLTLRVWDLKNLAPKVEDRTPRYQIEIGDYEIKFVDAHTIQYWLDRKQMLLDLLTGKSRPSKP